MPKSCMCLIKNSVVHQVFTTTKCAAFPDNHAFHKKTIKPYLQSLHLKVSVCHVRNCPLPLA